MNQRFLNDFYQVIVAIFCVIVIISNIISAKLVRLPYFNDINIPAGLIAYPLTFLLSDLVTEIYEAKQARLMVYIALGMSLLSYGLISLALVLPTQDQERQKAFESVLGLNGLILFASLTAYLLAQLIDIQLYAWLKKLTGPRFIWLRTNGSTLASQVVDSLTVNLIHLYWGLGMSLEAVFSVILFSYFYKAFFSVSNTPIFYACLSMIRWFSTKDPKDRPFEQQASFISSI